MKNTEIETKTLMDRLNGILGIAIQRIRRDKEVSQRTAQRDGEMENLTKSRVKKFQCIYSEKRIEIVVEVQYLNK